MKFKLSQNQAKDIWIQAQRLNMKNPFGNKGAQSVLTAIEQLGYVQIDTINVIERCHHHILYNRIPTYQKNHLTAAQTVDKTVFEYWTHAMSYIPTTDFKYFISDMKSVNTAQGSWFGSVTRLEYQKVKKLLQKNPVSIRDIKDNILKEKSHEWDSKKPSHRALKLGFNKGDFVVSEREGMLKKYDVTLNHFGWSSLPKAATEAERLNYVIDRAIKSQSIISLDSICHLRPKIKKNIEQILNQRVADRKLIEIELPRAAKIKHWISPQVLDQKIETSTLTHILSPFDPMIIQRKRLKIFFDYEHVFEAYIPMAKRKFGYFTLPVLMGNQIVAILDLKTDRQNQQLLIQNWIWLNKFKSAKNKQQIEMALDKFEKFQIS
jgi:uncharacterized protein YcaQ